MQNSLQIYRNEQPHLVVNIDEDTFFSHVVMGEHIISSSFVSDGPLDIDEGDYVILGGERFSINKTLPPVTKSAINELSYNLQFQGYIYDLHYCAFRHLGSSEFELFATADVFVGIMVGCLNNIYTGWSIGKIDVTEPKLIQFFENGKGFSCKGAIIKIAEAFGLEFWLTGKTLNLTAQAGVDTNITFEYGRGRGLYEIVRGEIDNELYFNRLYVEGSTRNIPVGYRGGMKRLQIDVPYLQLDIPAGKRIRETSVVIEDIFPKRVGTITAVSADWLTITDTSIDFDLNGSRIEGEKATVEMLTGENSGQSFEIDKYNHATKTIILVPNTETSGEVRPNATFEIKPDDQYFFAGIKVPETYIAAAEAELKSKGIELLKKAAAYVPPYSVRVSDKFMRDNGLKINAGDRVRLKDAALGIDVKIRVSAVKFALVDPYTVELLISDVIPYTSEDKNIIEIGNAKKETVVVNKVNAEKARRNMLDIRRLQQNVFDPDGYFDPENIKPNSIETLMLSVGAKSQNFGLNGVSINSNTDGDPNFVTVSQGALIHYEVQIEGLGYVWQMGAAEFPALDPTKTYFLSAKCRTTALTGEWVLSETPIKTEAETGYYHFYVGLFYPVTQGSRGYDLTNGMTFIVGDRITTGRIQSLDGLSFLDLSQNKFNVGDLLTGLDWDVTNAGQLTIRGNIVANNASFIGLIVQNLVTGRVKITALSNNIVFEDAQKRAILMIDDDGAIDGIYSRSAPPLTSPEGEVDPDFLYSKVVNLPGGSSELRYFFLQRGPGIRIGLSPKNSNGYSDMGRKGVYTNGKIEASYNEQGILFDKDGFTANGSRTKTGHIILENKVNTYRVLNVVNGLVMGVIESLPIADYTPLITDPINPLPSNDTDDTGYDPESSIPGGGGGTVDPPTEEPVDPPAEPPAGSPTTLLEAGYPLGFMVKSGTLNNANNRTSLIAHVVGITPENDYKNVVKSFDPATGVYTTDFSETDPQVIWAKANGKKLHIHTGHWPNHTASWEAALENNPLMTTQKWWDLLKIKIQAPLLHLKNDPALDGVADSYDVLNEIFLNSNDTASGTLRYKEDVYLRKLGPGYFRQAMIWAREADPRIKLFVNDVNFEYGGYKVENMKAFAGESKTENFPLDGWGLQYHQNCKISSTPTSGTRKNLKLLADTVDHIHLSEVALSLRYNPYYVSGQPFVLTPEMELLQAQKYLALMRYFVLDIPKAKQYRFTTWGIIDPDYLGADEEEFAMLLKADHSRKLAYDYMLNEMIQINSQQELPL